MKLLLELSMECESLARAEALAAAAALGGPPRRVCYDPGVMVMESSADPEALALRLGLCHHVNEYLCDCGRDEVEACARTMDVPGPIRVRSTKVGISDVDLSSVSRRVGALLGKAGGVDMHSPRNEVRVVFSDRAWLGRRIGSVDRPSFERRKNRYMPYFYPASLHPKFARAIVNLTGVKAGQKLLDPFCGTGAILAEASLIGLRAIGTDMSDDMIEGSRTNLRHLGARAELSVCDVGEIAEVVGRVQGIATDPPYGKSTSTKGEKIPDLYERSFSAFSNVLGRGSRMAIVVPSMKLLEGARGFRLTGSHELRVHRSLTRHFCTLMRL